MGWALLLGACSDGGETDATATGDEATSEDTTAAEEFVYVSPLGEFLGWDQGADFDVEAAEAEYAEQDRQVQEAIATCMAEQGFEYIPVDYSQQQISFEDEFDGLEWGSAEWSAKYGFGVSTQRFTQQQVGPDLVGYDDPFIDGGADSGPVDPNQAYVEGLAPAEADAYYEALYGGFDDYPVPIWEEEGREPTDEELEAYDREFQENYTPSGCEPIAYEEIWGAGPGGDEQFFAFDEEFGDELQALEERMESHPDVLAHREGVQACVQERGVEYLTEEDAWQYFEDEMDAAGLGWEAMPDPFDGLDTSGFTDEDFDRVWREAQAQPLPADKLEALAEIQAEEIATATAVHECGGGWRGEMEALAEVRIELEEQFLAENADRLAEYEGVFGS